MDESTLRALAKWPDVPDVFGWLRLDKRGQWRLKDEIVRHAGLIAFLGRNYECDAHGRWFVQNGPQRVYVALDYTPWVIRIVGIGENSQLETHTGVALKTLTAALLDDEGQLLIESEHGIGVIADKDLPTMLEAIQNQRNEPASETELLTLMKGDDVALSLKWQGASLLIERVITTTISARYGFVSNPKLIG